MDRAGLVGADGPTHHGAFDLTYLRLVPGMVIMAPKDESELRDMIYTAIQYKEGPIALRYPRGSAIGVEMKKGFDEIPIAKGEKLIAGDDVALLAVGSMVKYALKAAQILSSEEIKCEVVNMRFIKPIDTEILDYIAGKHTKIVTLEESTLTGGFGSAVLEYFNEKNYKNDVLRIGLPDNFVEHGTQKELHHILKIDPEGIVERVKIFYKNTHIKREITI
jgi:1-deoxy-D-xylulose-5-phosphate synthase